MIMPYMAFGQLVENFESGTITGWIQSTDSHWKADTISSISGRYSLHHTFDNPDAGTDQIGIPIDDLRPSMGDAKWSFAVRHGYDPSSANNWCVFLISDREPSAMIPGGDVSGFAIGVNLTGYDDTLRLWKTKGGTIYPILNTGINWQNDIGTSSAVSINVRRSASGIWGVDLFSQTGTKIGFAEATDPELFSIRWFGLFYRYTSTRDRLLWLDDLVIDGVFSKDIEPPVVISCQPVARNSVEITLNEEPDIDFIATENWSLNASTAPASAVIKLSPYLYRLTFNEMFINKSVNNLLINKLCDRDSNCVRNLTVPFTPFWAETGDIVISEVMADPEPTVSLPPEEYIEITNRTIYPYNLKNWVLLSGEEISSIPPVTISPGEYLILCATSDTSSFKKYGRVAGIKSFPSLTDAGKTIVLSDSSGNMIHGVEYSSDWYGDKLKSGGGWSLELIDINYPFYMSGNWTASVSGSGGTPGRKNSVESVNPDPSFTGLINTFPRGNSTLEVTFSEPVKDIENSLQDIQINGMNISSISPADPLLRKYLLTPESAFKQSRTYNITFPSYLTDFAGNTIQTNSYEFGIPEQASRGDILFNEILFNPLPGDPDYIELYNSSDKIINASDLYFISVSNDTGDTSDLVHVSGDGRCILPGSYYVVTTDREAVIARYFSGVPANIFQEDQVPSTPDDQGHLVLFNRQLDLIDEVTYSEKMHYSLLSGYEGIALEKLQPSSSSSDPANWHSASEASGWGTPGAANSVFSDRIMTEDEIAFSSTKITPDSDGNEDFLVISLRLRGNGNVVSILIFDETGYFIRKLSDNLLAGNQATVTWDGTGKDGSLVDSGIYIIFISVFDDNGKTKKWKKVCTVAR